jgi:hypothetical protein
VVDGNFRRNLSVKILVTKIPIFSERIGPFCVIFEKKSEAEDLSLGNNDRLVIPFFVDRIG